MDGIYWTYGSYFLFIGALIFCLILFGRRRNRRQ